MTPEKLLQAIGEIDDSFVEESAGRLRKFFGGNWGLVASAACLCLVIGGVVFLHDLGWMPYFPGPVQNTDPPAATTDPSDPTETTQPTSSETQPIETVPPEQLQEWNALFGDYQSWYNRTLICEYETPAQIRLLDFFYCGFPGENTATDAEWAALKDLPGFDENCDFFRLPVDQMNEVLLRYFGITLADVDDSGFEGLTYLESTDCYYFMTTSARMVEEFSAKAVEELPDGTVRLYYGSAHMGDMVATLLPDDDGYRVLSNVSVQNEIQKLFGEQGGWYNLALSSLYDSPAEVELRNFFYNGFDGMTEMALQEEKAQLKELSPTGAELLRLPASKMDEVLTQYFGITVDQMDEKSGAFAGMEYLESTDCWYYYGGATLFVSDFTVRSAMVLRSGILQVYYSTGSDTVATHIVELEPYHYGYRILSNQKLR